MAEEEDRTPFPDEGGPDAVAVITPSSATQEAPFIGPDAAPGHGSSAGMISDDFGVRVGAPVAVYTPATQPISSPPIAVPPEGTQHPRGRVHFQISNPSTGARIDISDGGARRINIGPGGRINIAGGVARANGNGGGGAGRGGRPRRPNDSNNDPHHPTAHIMMMPNVPMLPPLELMPNIPMLPPLEPRPMLPNQSSVESGAGEDAAQPSAKDMKKFECAICYEYMENPVGCGSCDTRFCKSCLQRVLRQAIDDRPPQSTDPPNSAKCPHCRSFFSPRCVVADVDLRKEIADCTDTVTCPNEGCGTELPIGMLKAHEATCPYMRLRCRYADWGCEWVGRKRDMEDHDRNSCEFRCGLGQLVERFRQGDQRAASVLQQHHMQIAAQSQMLTLHSRQAMMMRERDPRSLLDVYRLAYEASFFPGRFVATRDMWSGMINGQERRCAVCNVLLVVPSLALMFHVSFQGFKLLYGLQLDTISGDELWFLADHLLLSLIVSLLGILCIACFVIDSKGPADWTIYNVRNIIPGRPVLRDLAAITMAMAHFSVIEFLGTHPGVMMWQLTVIVTILFASFVSCIVETSSGGPTVLRSSRAWPVVIFGLRYGLLAALCGVAPSVSAVIVLRSLKRHVAVSSKVTVEDSECFIPQIGMSFLGAIAGVAFAFDNAVFQEEGIPLGITSLNIVLLDSVFAAFVLACVNGLVFLLDEAGRKLGERNVHAGTGMSPVGCAVFGVCSFLMLCISAA